MKGVSFVFILLFIKTEASFFDSVRGAISNINQGIGKLLGGVITDVKDTFYCTISAVGEVLVQNGLLDKRTLYNQKCKGTEKPKVESLIKRDDSQSKTVSKIEQHSVIHHKESTRLISHESEYTVENVNKTIINIVDNHNMDLKIAPDSLKAESNRSAEISKTINQESEIISENVKNEIKKMQLNKKPVLEEIQTSKNDTAVNGISHILDEVAKQIDLKNNFGTHELKELKKELQKYSSTDGKFNLTTEIQSLQGSPQNIAKKLKDIQEYSSTDGKLNLTTEIQSLQGSPQNTNTTIIFKDVALKIYEYKKENVLHKIEGNKYGQKQDSQFKSGKNIILGLGSDSLSSDLKSSVSPDYLDNVKKIVADSQHSDKVLSYFFKEQHFGLGNH